MSTASARNIVRAIQATHLAHSAIIISTRETRVFPGLNNALDEFKEKGTVKAVGNPELEVES
jgi:hypothetical protein